MTKTEQLDASRFSAADTRAQAIAPPNGRDENARTMLLENELSNTFNARAIREMLRSVGADAKTLRRTIRRTELRQIIPLADSTIYELERRGEFPKRFFLTPRCVVWDLTEVMGWLESRRRGGNEGVIRAPAPDFRLRKRER